MRADEVCGGSEEGERGAKEELSLKESRAELGSQRRKADFPSREETAWENLLEGAVFP